MRARVACILYFNLYFVFAIVFLYFVSEIPKYAYSDMVQHPSKMGFSCFHFLEPTVISNFHENASQVMALLVRLLKK